MLAPRMVLVLGSQVSGGSAVSLFDRGSNCGVIVSPLPQKEERGNPKLFSTFQCSIGYFYFVLFFDAFFGGHIKNNVLRAVPGCVLRDHPGELGEPYRVLGIKHGWSRMQGKWSTC